MFENKHIYMSMQIRLSLIVKKHKLNVYVLACTSLIGAAEYPSDPTEAIILRLQLTIKQPLLRIIMNRRKKMKRDFYRYIPLLAGSTLVLIGIRDRLNESLFYWISIGYIALIVLLMWKSGKNKNSGKSS